MTRVSFEDLAPLSEEVYQEYLRTTQAKYPPNWIWRLYNTLTNWKVFLVLVIVVTVVSCLINDQKEIVQPWWFVVFMSPLVSAGIVHTISMLARPAPTWVAGSPDSSLAKELMAGIQAVLREDKRDAVCLVQRLQYRGEDQITHTLAEVIEIRWTDEEGEHVRGRIVPPS